MLDGYRALAIKANRKLSLSSRRRKFFNRQHRCVFNFLQHSKSQARRICYFVFDLLVYQNRDLTQLPMIERRDTHTQLCTQIPLSEGCVRPPEVRSLERNAGTRASEYVWNLKRQYRAEWKKRRTAMATPGCPVQDTSLDLWPIYDHAETTTKLVCIRCRSSLSFSSSGREA